MIMVMILAITTGGVISTVICFAISYIILQSIFTKHDYSKYWQDRHDAGLPVPTQEERDALGQN